MLRRTAGSSMIRGRALRRSPTVCACVVAALWLALPTGGSARPPNQPLFELGRVGGTIEPFTVRIETDGTLDSSGAVRLARPNTQLSQARLASLLRYAQTQRFWSLPRLTACRGSLPDFASFYVTIHTASKTRTVKVRGGCKPRFTRVYRALSAAATVTQ